MVSFLGIDLDMPTSSERLRALAAWYREFADRAHNPAIWDARIRTAEELEMKAEALDMAVPASGLS
jgi:hypothetical protein